MYTPSYNPSTPRQNMYGNQELSNTGSYVTGKNPIIPAMVGNIGGGGGKAIYFLQKRLSPQLAIKKFYRKFDTR